MPRLSKVARTKPGRPPRVLVVCAIDSTAWLLLRAQIFAMRDRGWHVAVACHDGPLLRRFAREGVSIYPLSIARRVAPIANLKATVELYRLLRGAKYDLVHVHTPVASLVGRLAARAANVQLVVYTAHGFYFHEHMSPAARALHIAVERLFGRWTDFLFTQSGEDAQTAVDEGIIPADKVETIGNGVPVDDFQVEDQTAVQYWRQELAIPSDALVIGTVGRLVEEKGFKEFLDAARKLHTSAPNAVFLVVGDALKGDRDPFRARIAARLATDDVFRRQLRFSGFTEDVKTLVQLIDIFVLASYREGMPRSIIEAMAAGKPVVATDIRGCREEVADGITGFLVPVRDTESLARRIGVLAQDSSLREQMGRAGRARARALFDERVVVERVLTRLEAMFVQIGILPNREHDGSEGTISGTLPRPKLEYQ